MKQKIAIANDHAGTLLKKDLKTFLENAGYELVNFGTDSEASVDYPDYVHPAVESIEEGKCDLGILICGSAQGVAITANKHKTIRAAVCWQTEIAALARQHNNANVLCLPARFISVDEAKEIAQVFLKTEFEGGRHLDRVNKISSCCP